MSWMTKWMTSFWGFTTMTEFIITSGADPGFWQGDGTWGPSGELQDLNKFTIVLVQDWSKIGICYHCDCTAWFLLCSFSLFPHFFTLFVNEKRGMRPPPPLPPPPPVSLPERGSVMLYASDQLLCTQIQKEPVDSYSYQCSTSIDSLIMHPWSYTLTVPTTCIATSVARYASRPVQTNTSKTC